LDSDSNVADFVLQGDTGVTNSDFEGLEHLSPAQRGRVIASRWTGEDVSDIVTKDDSADHQSDMDDHTDDLNFEPEDDETLDATPEHVDDDDYDFPHVSSTEGK
jgi:hypothetical protein